MRPMIARYCAKRWTPEDDHELRAHLAELRGEIEEAGGPAAWLAIEASRRGVAPRSCHALTPATMRTFRRQPA